MFSPSLKKSKDRRKKCKGRRSKSRTKEVESLCVETVKEQKRVEIKTNLKLRNSTSVSAVGVLNSHTRCENSEKCLRAGERKDERKGDRCLHSSIHTGLFTICECAHFLRSSPGRHLMGQ